MELDNYIGKRFGRLLVTGTEAIITNSARKQPMAICLCDCGNRHSVSIQVLRSGCSQSCGCLRRELAIERGHRLHAERDRRRKEEEVVKNNYFDKAAELPTWLD